MDTKLWMYLVYLVVCGGLTVWVATTLARNGLVFLEDVFGSVGLAKSVNHLLVVGFCLLNLGYVTVRMRVDRPINGVADAMAEMSVKVGTVLLVLGALHFFNLFALGRYRRNRLRMADELAPRPAVAPLAKDPPLAKDSPEW